MKKTRLEKILSRFQKEINWLIAGLGVLIMVYWITRPRVPNYSNPVVFAPDQRSAFGVAPFIKDGFEIIPRARFELEARVLGKKRYSDGERGYLQPYDLAVSWGPMSNPDYLNKLSYWQSSRGVYVKNFNRITLPPKEVGKHIANFHLIFASGDILAAMADVERDKLIFLKGYLVDVKGRDGYLLKTSMTRKDIGNGACEHVYVEELVVY